MKINVETRLLAGLWPDGKIDVVRAELTELNKPLPRIPPLRGSVALDWRYRTISVRPETVMAGRQDRVFDNESMTAGYAIFNLSSSYSFFAKGTAHIFSFNGYNLTDRLYRNHLSLLKNIAPAIGRGARISYTVRF